MFTGIVEELGEVKGIQRGSQSISLIIKATKVLENIQLGDSIATNGVCLTVTSFSKDQFSIDVMPETMRYSSLGDLKVGSRVNLERALSLSSRLGGHLVSGHIDAVGRITVKRREGNANIVTISPPEELLKYIIHKGSIAIDGVSLTVASVQDDSFVVSLIPHTSQVTLLGEKEVGAKVNLEADLIGKYVERILNFRGEQAENHSAVNLELLRDSGFL